MSEMNIEVLRRVVAEAIADHAAVQRSPWTDSEQAAEYLGCTSGTLKTWRSRGEGPRFHVIQRKLVRYHVNDLDEFVRSGTTQ